jgi:type II secretory pathway pseudopilin PulG
MLNGPLHLLSVLRAMRGISAARRRHAGFTLVEVLGVLAVTAAMTSVLINRLSTYQELAEKSAMEQTAGVIRSAITIQIAGLIARGNMEDIPRLAAVNPMNLLAEKPKNYAGEVSDSQSVPPGNWYYDPRLKQLVYLIEHGENFVSSRGSQKLVRYRVKTVYNEGFGNASSKTARREIGGVILEEVEPYKWAIKQDKLDK